MAEFCHQSPCKERFLTHALFYIILKHSNSIFSTGQGPIKMSITRTIGEPRGSLIL